MEELFLNFWNRSVAAGWLILAVTVLRLLLKKAPKSVRCLLWLLVGIRLVCPFSIQSAASLIPSAEAIPPVILEQRSPQINSGLAFVNGPVNEYLSGHVCEGITQPVGYTWDIISFCAEIWLTGMVLLVLWGLMIWLRLRRRVAEAIPEGNGVWLCDRIVSPFLLGIFRPRIYLPFGLDSNVRTYVTAHERAHIKRLDHLTKPAGFLLLAVYWFQPLVWLAYVLLCRDIELACDEQVIRELGITCKKPYSEALLQCSVKRDGSAVCPLAFSEVGVKERVKNVLNYKKPAFWAAAVSLAVCAVAAVCFLTDPVDSKGNAVIQDMEPVPLNQNTMQTGHHDGCYHSGHAAYDNDELYSTDFGGALMYEPLTYSSYFPAWHPSLKLTQNTLTLTGTDGISTLYNLTETAQYTTESFYSLFPDLRQQEADCGTTLLPQDTQIVTRYTYQSAEPDTSGNFHTECIWEVTGKQVSERAWIGSERLYSLIHNPDWEGIFCYDNCVLWDYDPQVSTVIPIRFELDGPISILAKSGTLLANVDGQLQNIQQTRQEIKNGETVYWQPSTDGAPEENASLIYRYSLGENGEAQDRLELHSLMDNQGLYGSKTYGIANNWLGMLSSAIHYSAVEADMETGELLVRRSKTFPYETNTDGMPRVDGTRLPPKAVDSAAAQ